LNFKVAKTSNISISFDVSKVDEIKAASFIKEVK
jgi:pyruvate/2-oxoglutarate dehydrogenase complex dihydrolipoamide acyltransferase (E2) component